MAGQIRGMILAAGLGTRLRPLTYFRAKAAVPFLNRPLISYSLEMFRGAGIDHIMINLHYLPDSIRRALSKAPQNMHFSVEEQVLGTAGSLRKVRDFLKSGTVVVSNGKIYFEEELAKVIDFHHQTGAMVTMVLVPVPSNGSFNPVLMDAQNRIVAFTRSGTADLQQESCEAFVYTGVQVLDPEVLDWIPPGVSDTVNDVYPRLMARGYPVQGYVSEAYWCECSTPRRYLIKSLEVLRRRRMENLCPVELPPSCSGAIVGEEVRVPASTVLQDTIVWGNVNLGRDSSFQNVIITDGVGELPANTLLQNVVVTPRVDEAAELTGLSQVGSNYTVWPLA